MRDRRILDDLSLQRQPREQMTWAVVDAVLIEVAILVSVFLQIGGTQGFVYLETCTYTILATCDLFIVTLYLSRMDESDGFQRRSRILISALMLMAFYATLANQLGRGVFVWFVRFACFLVLTQPVDLHLR